MRQLWKAEDFTVGSLFKIMANRHFTFLFGNDIRR
jgi:hypothetical protein